MISGIILASGFSKRYGEDKLLQKINLTTIIEQVVAHCVKSQLDEIIVIYRKDEILELLQSYPVKKVQNLSAENGMSESMKLGINHLNENSEACMILMGDQPYFETKDIDNMIDVYQREKMITVASSDGKRRTPVIFPSRFYHELLQVNGDQGGRMIVDNPSNLKIFVEFGDRQLMDIDTKDDLKK